MADDRPRSPGARVGSYTLLRLLGTGGSSEVWEAELHGPAGFRKRVALKILQVGPGRPAQRDTLLREARLGALMHHPNIVGTLGVDEVHGCWHIALELVRGAPLSDLVRHGPLPAGAVMDVAIQTAAALAHVHALREGRTVALVHRDVKPSNLLVDENGTVKLADLGISLLHGEQGGLAGTPGFMAPEQALGRPEPASDVFSLGATLYLLASGRRPFGTGARALEAVRSVETLLNLDAFLAPVEAAVEGLGSVLRCCLARRPADRPTSRELLDLLAPIRGQRDRDGPTLLQLLVAALPAMARPDRPAVALPARSGRVGNFPPARDAFVGRTDALGALDEAVRRGDRVIVVTGLGGIGKSRLVAEFARRLEPQLEGGAWGVDLQVCGCSQDIWRAVAAALGLELGREPRAQVGQALGARGRSLVVLDDADHCAAALVDDLSSWTAAAPDAVFVCTTRAARGLPPASVFALSGLAPDDARALFRARAESPMPGESEADLEAVCDALDGIPLAIELAAARVRVVGVRGLRGRLGLDVLSGGGLERPPRHRSVTDSLDVSHRLLSPRARRAWECLSVFEGGFTLLGAAAVCDEDSAGTVLDPLRELADAGLLRLDPAGDRFSMLNVSREFGRAKLGPSGLPEAEARHGLLFAQLGGPEAVDALDGPGGLDRLCDLALELENLVAACRRATGRADAHVAAGSAIAAFRVLEVRGPIELALELVLGALGLPGLSRDDRIRLDGAAAGALKLVGRIRDARRHYETALSAASGGRLEGWVRRNFAVLLMESGQFPEAHLHLDAAIALQREGGHRVQLALALGSLGTLRAEQGRLDEAEVHYRASLDLHRRDGNPRSEGVVLANLGTLNVGRGRLDEARGFLEGALAIHRRIGARRLEGAVLANLGNLHRSMGQPEQAAACYRDAIELHRSYGDRRMEANTRGNLGALLHVRGDREGARGHYEASLAVHRELGNLRFEGIVLSNLGDLDAEEGRIDEARRRYDQSIEANRACGNRRMEGAVLSSLAGLDLHGGDLSSAADHLAQAEPLIRLGGDERLLTMLLARQEELAARRSSTRAEASPT